MELITKYKRDLNPIFFRELSLFLEKGFRLDTYATWEARFKFSWCANPYITENIPIGWVLTDENNSILGFLGNYPCPFKAGKNIVLSAAAGGWYVDETVRDLSSSLMYVAFGKQKNIEIFLNTTPSIKVQKSLQKLGYKLMSPFIKPKNNLQTNYMVIISYGSFFKAMSILANHFAESAPKFMKKVYGGNKLLLDFFGKIFPKSREIDQEQILTSNYHEIRLLTNSNDFIKKISYHRNDTSIELLKDKKTLDWLFFSPEVQNLFCRSIAHIYTKAGEYLGYFIYDRQHVGTEKLLRLRELQLLIPDDNAVKLIIAHLKREAKIHGCAAVYSGLQRPEEKVDKLLSKHILLKVKTKGRYYVKFRKNSVEGVADPYAIFIPSDLDPDVGFI